MEGLYEKLGELCKIGVVAAIFMGTLGCDQMPPSVREAGRMLQVGLASLTGSTLEGTRPQASPSIKTDEEFSTLAAKNAKGNAEILREMLQVVYNREPKDRTEFGNWADTLNQGASFEGVHNGLTHSTIYRKLELSATSASVEALKAFSEELAYLEVELPTPTLFDKTGAPILQPPNELSELEKKTPKLAMDALHPSPSPDKQELVQILAEKYAKQFVGISIFMLKRVLCDEALKVIDLKAPTREKLALWYSRFVVRIAQRNIDFGVSLRNKPDEAFHYKWAAESSVDHLKWEVLNRYHRVLNETNRVQQ